MPAPYALPDDDFATLDALSRDTSASGLKALGQAISELSRANQSLSRAGLPKKDAPALVMTDRGIATIRAYEEVEHIFTERDYFPSPAVQLTACIDLLMRLDKAALQGAVIKPRFSRTEIQLHMSRLLVDHPVLMDHRLLFGVAGTGAAGERADCYATAAGAIAYLSLSSLPSLSHGIRLGALREFAAHPCVRSGVTKRSAALEQSAFSKGTLRDEAPLDIVVGASHPPELPGCTRGGFLTSVLELSALAQSVTGRGYVAFNAGASNSDPLYFRLAKTFWDVAARDGALSNVSRERFVAAMNTPALAKQHADAGLTVATGIGQVDGRFGALRHHLACRIDDDLFDANPDRGGASSPNEIGFDEMTARTIRAACLLVDCGLESDTADAAQWLADVACGDHRMNSAYFGPLTTVDTALGFLNGIDRLNVDARAPRGLVDFTDRPPNPMLPGSTHQRQSAHVWGTALGVHGNRVAMERVISAGHGAPAASAPNPLTPAPRTIRRGV